MRLFVGLGNPGPRYAGNRHNIGFMALDHIARAHDFGPWQRKFQAEVAEGLLGREKTLLLKPQTFMNLSGNAVADAVRFYKLSPADLIVFHDELDIAPGKCRLKQGGGHAGHNGLRSIMAHLGPDFWRVRLGIGHPGHKDAVASYVLHDFAKDDATWIAPLLDGLADGAPALAAAEGAKFQNAVALRVAPPRNKDKQTAPNLLAATPKGAPSTADTQIPAQPGGSPRTGAGSAPSDPPPHPQITAPADTSPFAALRRLIRD